MLKVEIHLEISVPSDHLGVNQIVALSQPESLSLISDLSADLFHQESDLFGTDRLSQLCDYVCHRLQFRVSGSWLARPARRDLLPLLHRLQHHLGDVLHAHVQPLGAGSIGERSLTLLAGRDRHVRSHSPLRVRQEIVDSPTPEPIARLVDPPR